MNFTVLFFAILFGVLTLGFMTWAIGFIEESKVPRFASLMLIIFLSAFWYEILN